MKTLVVRFSSAGDIILTSLFIRALRKRFPEAKITFLTKRSFAPLVENSPHIDRVLTVEDGSGPADAWEFRRQLLEEDYDVVFDLHNSLRSRITCFGIGKERVFFKKPSFRKWLLVRFKINLLRPVVPIPERYLAAGERFGLENDGEGLELSIGQTQSPLPDNLTEPIIALAPGARHFTKRWPAERYATLANELLKAYGGTILLLGGPEEREVCGEVERKIGDVGGAPGDGKRVLNLAGETTLLEAAAAIDRCSIVISNDSALAHVAAARKVPVIAIFGSTVEEFGFAPYSKQAIVIQNEGLPCRPCTTIGRSECPKGHFKCMREIAPEEVRTKAEMILRR